jgi:hypothetical protein
MEHRFVYHERGGVRRTMIFDDEKPDRVTVHTEQTLDEIMTSIERDRDDHRERGDVKLIARIPAAIGEQLLVQGDDALRKFLNDSDFSRLRIWPGRV